MFALAEQCSGLRLLLFATRHLVSGFPDSLAESLLMLGLLGPDIGATFAKVDPGPDTVHPVQRVLDVALAVRAGHAFDGQDVMVGIVGGILVVNLETLDPVLFSTATPTIEHLSHRAPNGKQHHQQ